MNVPESTPTEGELLRAMIHEVRTPTQTLVGLAELLQPDTRRDRLESLLTQLRRDTLRLLAAVDDASLRDDLLEDNLFLELRPFAIGEVLTDIGQSIEAFYPDRFELAYQDTQGVRGDPTLTRRLLWFLVVNALRATPDSADPALLETVGKGGRLEIRVLDHGAPIPEDAALRLFEPLARMPGTFSWPRFGLGRGLVPGREVARRMGGDLWLERAPDGNTFVLALPLVEATP